MATADLDRETLERLENEDAEHESPGVTIEQVQADIDKAMEVQAQKEGEGVEEQQAKQQQAAADEAAASASNPSGAMGRLNINE